jgi:hypothetical protein
MGLLLTVSACAVGVPNPPESSVNAEVPSVTGQIEAPAPWGRGFSGGVVQDISIAPSNEVVLVASYQGKLETGGGELPNHGSEPAPPWVIGPWEGKDFDCALVRYSPTGQHRWSRGFGKVDGQCQARSLAVDSSENTVVATSMFFAKFSPHGRELWRTESPPWSLAHGVQLEVRSDGTIVALATPSDLAKGPWRLYTLSAEARLRSEVALPPGMQGPQLALSPEGGIVLG